MALLVFAFVNFIFYPNILHYQAGTRAGRWIAGQSETGAYLRAPVVYTLEEAPASYSFEFDCPKPVLRLRMDSLSRHLQHGAVYIFAPAAFADSLEKHGYAVQSQADFSNFHVSQLTGEFLNYRTRASVLETWSLLKVQ
jgi:hypothetical protein